MKAILILVFTFWTISILGQTPPNRINVPIINSKTDTVIKVIYADKVGHKTKPAYFLNGTFVGQTLLTTIKPLQIDSISIVSDHVKINNIEYDGQIHIRTKSSYAPKLISLTDLKAKYTNLKGEPAVLFTIDGNIINADHDNCMVDESYILSITVEEFENIKGRSDLKLIKLLTRTDENIEKSNRIMIRGTEMTPAK